MFYIKNFKGKFSSSEISKFYRLINFQINFNDYGLLTKLVLVKSSLTKFETL